MKTRSFRPARSLVIGGVLLLGVLEFVALQRTRLGGGQPSQHSQ